MALPVAVRCWRVPGELNSGRAMASLLGIVARPGTPTSPSKDRLAGSKRRWGRGSDLCGFVEMLLMV
jgi:hypothetical protein